MEMVKTLLPICKIDHLDNDGNSVFHYAAGTTKEIINVSIKIKSSKVLYEILFVFVLRSINMSAY